MFRSAHALCNRAILRRPCRGKTKYSITPTLQQTKLESSTLPCALHQLSAPCLILSSKHVLHQRREIHSSTNIFDDATKGGQVSEKGEGDEDIGDLETSPASNLTLRDLSGPWLVMSSAFEGEMIIHEDGFVTFKMPPSHSTAVGTFSSFSGEEDGGLIDAKPNAPLRTTLGNMIGRIRIIEEPTGCSSEAVPQKNSDGHQQPSSSSLTPNSITLFRIDMESYTYERHSSDHPPFFPSRYALTGVVSHALTEKASYKTLTLSGHADPLEDSSATSDVEFVRSAKANEKSPKDCSVDPSLPPENDLFYAAKLVPWDPAADAGKWEPSEEFANSFDSIFGHLPLKVTSHINRAMKCALEAVRIEEQKSGQTPPEQIPVSALASHNLITGPPYHLDMAPYRVGTIPTIYYVPNYISEVEEAQFMGHLKATPDILKSKLPKRTCQEWGGTMCSVCNKSFLADTNIPPWAEKINEMLLFDGIFTPTTFPNSVRIHEYNQFEGIGPHCDGPIYVPLVAVLSMASMSVMHFYPRTEPYGDLITEHYNDTFKFEDGDIGKRAPIASVVLEPRSLLLFTDEAFTHYPHGVSDKPIDNLDGANCINRHLLSEQNRNIREVPRKYRASVTVRNLLPRCEHEPQRNDFMMKRAWYFYNQLPLPIAPTVHVSELTNSKVSSHKEVKPLSTSGAPSAIEASSTRFPSFVHELQTNDKNDSHKYYNYERTASSSAASKKSVTASELTGGNRPEVLAESNSSVQTNEMDVIRRDLSSLSAFQKSLANDVAEIKNGIAELKTVIGFSFTSATTFQKETSSILNNLSIAVMDVTSKQEELSGDLQTLQKRLDNDSDK